MSDSWYMEKLALAEFECLFWKENNVLELVELFEAQANHYREVLGFYS